LVHHLHAGKAVSVETHSFFWMWYGLWLVQTFSLNCMRIRLRVVQTQSLFWMRSGLWLVQIFSLSCIGWGIWWRLGYN
jgi:hypothetical protein